MNKVIYLSIALLCAISCSNKKEKTENNMENTHIDTLGTNLNQKFINDFLNYEYRHVLIDSVITHGDTTSYEKLHDIYGLSGHSKEFLYYAMCMANRYNYSQAYLHVFMLMDIDADTSLKNSAVLSNVGLSKLKKYYLLKAFSLGNKSASYYMDKEFGKNLDSVNVSQRLKIMHRELFEDIY